MKWHAPLPLFFLLLVGGATEKSSPFTICAFNVQNFNSSKASNYRVKHILTQVVSRCSICLLQEVKDPDAIKSLVSALNRYDDYKYESVSSGPLGNSPSNMEQYVFIYRKKLVKVKSTHQYRKTQSFVREPFVVQFHCEKTAVQDFVLVPLRSEPSQAVQEIDRLYDVYSEVVHLWNNKNVMFLGDFHASCTYMTRQDKPQIRLFTKKGFYWLIEDRVDTTVTKETSCAYDRIVVSGDTFQKAIKPHSAQVFNYGKTLRVPKDQVLTLSDHLPVLVHLRSSAHLLQATPILILLSTLQSFM